MKIVPWIFWENPDERSKFITILQENNEFTAMTKVAEEFNISLSDASKAIEAAKKRIMK